MSEASRGHCLLWQFGIWCNFIDYLLYSLEFHVYFLNLASNKFRFCKPSDLAYGPMEAGRQEGDP